MLLRAASGASGHGIRRAPNHAAAQVGHGQAIGGGAVAQAPVHVRGIFPQRDGEAVAFTAEGAGKGQDAAYRHIDGGELALDGVLDGLAGGGRGRGIGQAGRQLDDARLGDAGRQDGEKPFRRDIQPAAHLHEAGLGLGGQSGLGVGDELADGLPELAIVAFFQLQPGPGDDRHQLLLHGIEPFGGNGGGRHGDGGIAFGELVVRRGRGRVDAMHGYSSM